MKRAGHHYVDDTCIGCGACEHACPGRVDAIWRMEDDYLGRFTVIAEACIDCGFCIGMCPVGAVHDSRVELPPAGAGRGAPVTALARWAAERRGGVGTRPRR